MSTQPSEHAQRAAGELLGLALKTLVPGNGIPDGIGLEASRIIDTHAVEPATRELREALKVMMRHVENYVPDIPAGGYIDHDLKLAAAVLAKYEEKS
jgi:hypothetical protein